MLSTFHGISWLFFSEFLWHSSSLTILTHVLSTLVISHGYVFSWFLIKFDFRFQIDFLLFPRLADLAMLQTLPATSVGQRVILDARNACSSRQENLQEVDQFLSELETMGKPTVDNLEKMCFVWICLMMSTSCSPIQPGSMDVYLSAFSSFDTQHSNHFSMSAMCKCSNLILIFNSSIYYHTHSHPLDHWIAQVIVGGVSTWCMDQDEDAGAEYQEGEVHACAQSHLQRTCEQLAVGGTLC